MVLYPYLQQMPANINLLPHLYRLPFSNQKVAIMPDALDIFAKYRQTGETLEAGGLLFATFQLPSIHIVDASEPHILDGRDRFRFFPNRLLQRRLIKKKFKQGLHFVGEWHTHPEPTPRPSLLDLESMGEAFLKSRHELNWFLMIIVGNKEDALRLWVSVHNAAGYHEMQKT